MAKKRERRTVIAGVTREMAEAAFAQYAKADAKLTKIAADIELQCTRIRERYAAEIAALEEEKCGGFELLQAYAVNNQEELFGRRRSIEMAHGCIGFRMGTPKLKTLKGFTWAASLNLVKEYLPGYVRASYEVAKDKLLADRDGEGMADAMARCGIQVVQDESFYVETKSEESNS